MITPQQIEQISFSKSTFGGYDMEQVDKILEPLTEDYVALYKENALLKSKMRVLVGKLEEYRKNEAAAKETVLKAREAAQKMVQETKAKCEQMMRQAKTAAPEAESGPSADALVAVEKARVAEARKAAAARITEIQSQMQSCIQALDRIKNASVAPTAPAAPAAPQPKKVATEDVYDSEAVADEISQNMEAMVNAAAPAAEHPMQDTTSRFANLNLQFGKNYDPTQK